jgi:hypothetical protein
MATKKTKLLDNAASDLLIQDLLSSRPVAEVMKTHANTQAVLSILVNGADEDVVTPEQYALQCVSIQLLRQDLSRAVHWNTIRSFKLVFEVGTKQELIVDDHPFTSEQNVREYLRKQINEEGA